jgi:hypothetical protein
MPGVSLLGQVANDRRSGFVAAHQSRFLYIALRVARPVLARSMTFKESSSAIAQYSGSTMNASRAEQNRDGTNCTLPASDT